MDHFKGAGSQIGPRGSLWIGENLGKVFVGDDATLAPDRFLTASNYRLNHGELVTRRPAKEVNLVVGAGCWLGAGVILTSGMKIGEGAAIVVGAAVTRDVPGKKNCHWRPDGHHRASRTY